MSLKLTFYGDDFTGATAVMEVLSFAGVPTMLFLDAPGPEVLARYPGLGAIGVAGVARSRSPAWMRQTLPAVFETLKALGAPLCHYKVCSTFDSAPETGSIGVAAEIGAEVFAPPWMPLVVGAPAIGRYQVFGTLFAAFDGAVHRLDRHPVMARHPVTPMAEADLARHLAAQTAMPVGLVDFVAMADGLARARLDDALRDGARLVALDALDAASLRAAGALIWGAGTPGFAVGSQGVEYALVAHWQATGALPAAPSLPRPGAVDCLFAVSGSCSATTAQQIARAEAAGFTVIGFDAARAVDPLALAQETACALETALRALGAGRDVVVATARGPDDPGLTRMTEALQATGADAGAINEALGRALGGLVADVRQRTGLARAAICGGDTSGHALSVLGAEALSPVAPLAPGAPLCRVHVPGAPTLDGLEVTLKGGQMGPVDFLLHAKAGHG